MAVRCAKRFSMAVCSRFSVSESTNEVASSRTINSGTRAKARAIDTSCFSPLDRDWPPSAKMVSRPRGSFSTRASQQADRRRRSASLSIPVADFFRAAAEKMQNLYGYKPGRDMEEKIPMLSFGVENVEKE